MKIIGITGGVGAGKSQVLSYIKENYNARILLADEVAHLLEEPGHDCYDRLVALLGKDILQEDLFIDKKKMADKIFKDKPLLIEVNKIVHPAVKKYIVEEIENEKKKKELNFFFVEAALLIEEHYDLIVDELWYIYADEKVRAERLRQNRNYSDEKIQAIFRGQLSETEFRNHCKVVINNNGDINETYREIDNNLV